MKLIDDWKKCWKYLSVQANAIGIAMSGAYATFHDDLKDVFPAHWMMGVVGTIFALGIVGRLISQDKPADPK